MRNLCDQAVDQFRDCSWPVVRRFGGPGDVGNGAFWIPSPIDGKAMRVIASTDLGWDHVSVSRTNRPPNWTEMQYVARLFFGAGETAMQLHVPEEDHVNIHPHCLHLWRPQDYDIPRPPAWMVG